MTVFISWSGDESKAVAEVFREWFPKIIQGLPVFMSAQDIPAGTRWFQEIAGQLEESAYGVICVTPENEASPWLNFEAGAIGKVTNGAFVSPVAISMSKNALTGPLGGFNAVDLDKEGIMTLLESINEAQGSVPWLLIAPTAEAFWDHVEEALEKRPRGTTPEPAFDANEALIEIRTLVRSLAESGGRGSLPDAIEPYLRQRDGRKIVYSFDVPDSVPLAKIHELLKAYRGGDSKAGEVLRQFGLDPDLNEVISQVARSRSDKAARRQNDGSE